MRARAWRQGPRTAVVVVSPLPARSRWRGCGPSVPWDSGQERCTIGVALPAARPHNERSATSRRRSQRRGSARAWVALRSPAASLQKCGWTSDVFQHFTVAHEVHARGRVRCQPVAARSEQFCRVIACSVFPQPHRAGSVSVSADEPASRDLSALKGTTYVGRHGPAALDPGGEGSPRAMNPAAPGSRGASCRSMDRSPPAPPPC
jgi:hypothetical protein